MQGEYRQRIKIDYGHPTAGFLLALLIFISSVGLYVLSRWRGGSATGGSDRQTIQFRKP
jgi:hypothetical protein